MEVERRTFDLAKGAKVNLSRHSTPRRPMVVAGSTASLPSNLIREGLRNPKAEAASAVSPRFSSRMDEAELFGERGDDPGDDGSFKPRGLCNVHGLSARGRDEQEEQESGATALSKSSNFEIG